MLVNCPIVCVKGSNEKRVYLLGTEHLAKGEDTSKIVDCRSHRTHRVQNVARCCRCSVVCLSVCLRVSVCLLETVVSPARTAKPIEMPLGCGLR